jgi:hypothetical protein
LNTTQSRKKSINEETRKRLKIEFKEDNRKLSKLLGKELPWQFK